MSRGDRCDRRRNGRQGLKRKLRPGLGISDKVEEGAMGGKVMFMALSEILADDSASGRNCAHTGDQQA